MHTVSNGQALKQSGTGVVSGGQQGMSSAMSDIDMAGAAPTGIGAIKGALNSPTRASATSVRARSVRNAMGIRCHFGGRLKRPASKETAWRARKLALLITRLLQIAPKQTGKRYDSLSIKEEIGVDQRRPPAPAFCG